MEKNTIVLAAENKKVIDNIKSLFNPTLVYITKGQITAKINEDSYTANKDAMMILSPFDNISTIEFTDDTELTEVVLDSANIYSLPSPMLISVLKSRPDGFKNVIDCTDDRLISVIFNKIVDEFSDERLLRNATLNNAVTQLLIEVYRLAFRQAQQRHIDLITNIQECIDNEYMNDITIEELGSRFYLDRYYLSHIFRDYTGYSLKQYLTLTRLNQSRILLVTTSLSINEICTKIGFSDINNYIRYFRKEYATTPLAYRKSLKKNNQ